MPRKIFAIAFMASTLAAGALATKAMSTAVAAAPSASVKIANFTFQAPVVAVKPGTTVTWVNADDIPHTVTANNGAFKSKVLDSGDRFTFTFAKAGEYAYFCSLHPRMTGKIIVKG
ncbi:MAG TPA: cupredoxin family copper-binding protein [Sphingomicrobium sp.]|jgi:plastocyanin|nr:cupredoxin family copper-binding protein [Sphingomicrobium sp.]